MSNITLAKIIRKLPESKDKIGENCTAGLKTSFKKPFKIKLACINGEFKDISHSDIKLIRVTGYQEKPLIEVTLLNNIEVLISVLNENKELFELYLNA